MKRVALLLCLSPFAFSQTQVPNVFEDSTPAKAEEVNENFQYVLENASGGCSATQQDNSVLIECADGTSGVLAGAGTVVIIPEGSVTGGPPDTTEFETGDFYWVDGNDIVLSEWLSNMTNRNFVDVKDASGYRAYFEQIDDAQALVLRLYGTYFYFTQADCEGTAFSTSASADYDGITKYQGKYYVADSNSCDTGLCNQPTIARSRRYFDNFTSGEVGDNGPSDCENYETEYLTELKTFWKEYTPPAEWLNAAYPIKLVQKP